MGVQRQTAKINWISSLALIVAAGTLYRTTNFFRKYSKLQVKDLKQKIGLIYPTKNQQPSIVPRPVSKKRGDWQQILLYRKQYKIFSKLYCWSEGSFRRKD